MSFLPLLTAKLTSVMNTSASAISIVYSVCVWYHDRSELSYGEPTTKIPCLTLFTPYSMVKL